MSDSFLWVLPKWPLPDIDGSRKAACSLISSLTREGAVIDICVVAGENESFDIEDARRTLGVRDIFIVRRDSTRLVGIGSLLGALSSLLVQPGVPVTFRYYSSKKVKDGLTRLIEKYARRWEFVVYEGLHPAIHRQRPDGNYQQYRGLKTIYRAQNIESDLWFQKAQKTNFILRNFFNQQARLVERFENGLVVSSALTACVSDEDERMFQKKCQGANVVTVPIGYSFEPLESVKPEEGTINLLFLGRLDWAPNKEGLKWFLDEVWPVASRRNKSLKLTVAGSGNGAWLKSYEGQANTAFLGRVPETSALYSQASLCLVPVFFGSGTRVKAIEAATFGRPCLSTALGVSGLGLKAGEDYLRAETAREWISLLETLTQVRLRETGTSAYLRLKHRFDSKRCAAVFLREVRCVKSARQQAAA